MMQLQDIVTRVRKTLGELEPSGYGSQQAGQGSWDNSQIIGYVNEALGLLAHDWRKEASTTVNLTLNQSSVPIPTDALEDGLRTPVYVTQDGTNWPMRYLDFSTYQTVSQLQETQPQTGYPTDRTVYTLWNGNILLYPGAYTSQDKLLLYYYRTPALMPTGTQGTEVPEIPSRFHIALVEYAIAECQNAVEESNLESDAMQKWQMYRAQFKAEMARNQRDRGIRVRGRK